MWVVGHYFFFFQAEDGIRDLTVTGVQTCALPISLGVAAASRDRRGAAGSLACTGANSGACTPAPLGAGGGATDTTIFASPSELRGSEERRVGKEGRSRGWPYH